MFGKVVQGEVRPIARKEIKLIRDLLARKRQLNEIRTQKLNREYKAPKVLTAPHRRLLKLLDKEIDRINE